MSSQQEQLEAILPCVSCGVNADPADGFGRCTCGREAQRAAITALIQEAVKEGREAELNWFLELLPDLDAPHTTVKVENRIKQLSGGSNNG